MTTRRYPPGTEPGLDRAGDLVSELLGSWTFLCVVLVVVAFAAAFADLHDGGGAVAAIDVIVPGLAVAAVPLILRATRHADRAAGERALRHLEAARRVQAAGDEILGELDQVNAGLARLAARMEIMSILVRTVDGDRRHRRS